MILTNITIDTEPELYFRRLSLDDLYSILTAKNWTEQHKDAVITATAAVGTEGAEYGEVKITRRNGKNSVNLETLITTEYEKEKRKKK